jgi:hypothetical protein
MSLRCLKSSSSFWSAIDLFWSCVILEILKIGN